MMQKFPMRVCAFWVVLVLTFYALFRGEFSVDLSAADKFQTVREKHFVDAFVFIAMGKMAGDPMVDYALSSVRRLGKWKGDIYLVTDSPKCFENSIRDYHINVVTTAPVSSIIEVKAMKPSLMSFMPSNISSILYMDVDVLVMRNLVYFLSDFSEITERFSRDKKGYTATASHSSNSNSTLVREEDIDFGAFLDAKGHYVGWCSGCEKWHTGVMWFKRGFGSSCLKAWRKVETHIHYTNIRIYSYTHTLIHSYMHTLIHAYTHTRTHAHTHTRIHSYTIDTVVWKVYNRSRITRSSRKGRVMSKCPILPHTTPSLRQGLHCHASNSGTIFRACHSRR